MALEVYLDLCSQPCRSVYIFAKKTNIPFDFKKVSLMEGEQYGEDFGKINMIRKVPAVQDGDFCLSESIAIMMYLAEKFGTPEHWYPSDLQKRARVNEYLSWQHMAIRMHGSKIFWMKLMIPKIMGVELPKEKMDAALEDLNSSLTLIEEKFLQDRPFIAGEHISLADLVAVVEVMQPVGVGVDVFEGRARLRAWRDRVREEVGVDVFEGRARLRAWRDRVREEVGVDVFEGRARLRAWRDRVREEVGVDVFEGRARLRAWRDRVREEVGAELFDEAHQDILAAQDMIKKLDASKMQAFRPKILSLFF